MVLETTLENVYNLLKNKQLHYFNFYNNDIKYSIQKASKWYENNSNDNINNIQNLNIIYLDIECFTYNNGMDDEIIESGNVPINIVTIYTSKDKIYHTFVLLLPEVIEKFGIKNNITNDEYNKFIIDRQNLYKQWLKDREYSTNKYIPEFNDLKLYLYLDEKQLLLELWKTIHFYDPEILTSWNGDRFDYWYIYNRIKYLFGEDQVNKILSKFGNIKIHNKMVQFFEYTVADLLYMYKPRDEGGF